ncbi:hypothetical protein MKX08_002843 [Trichoderma sp. CBMAI-0020]|nr:hypothetical protein MKX08_002843 [Trichoderma sp. CBMAI-0020]
MQPADTYYHLKLQLLDITVILLLPNLVSSATKIFVFHSALPNLQKEPIRHNFNELRLEKILRLLVAMAMK